MFLSLKSRRVDRPSRSTYESEGGRGIQGDVKVAVTGAPESQTEVQAFSVGRLDPRHDTAARADVVEDQEAGRLSPVSQNEGIEILARIFRDFVLRSPAG